MVGWRQGQDSGLHPAAFVIKPRFSFCDLVSPFIHIFFFKQGHLYRGLVWFGCFPGAWSTQWKQPIWFTNPVKEKGNHYIILCVKIWYLFIIKNSWEGSEHGIKFLSRVCFSVHKSFYFCYTQPFSFLSPPPCHNSLLCSPSSHTTQIPLLCTSSITDFCS